MESTRARRPLGVTLLTFYDAVFVGAIPAALAFWSFFQAAPEARDVLTGAFAPLVLSAGIIYTAAGTYRGESAARLWLLGLVTLHYVGIGFEAPFTVDLVSFVQPETSGSLEVWLRAVRSLFWIVLHGWLLLVSRASSYFES